MPFVKLEKVEFVGGQFIDLEFAVHEMGLYASLRIELGKLGGFLFNFQYVQWINPKWILFCSQLRWG
jgi:hypothetical protein